MILHLDADDPTPPFEQIRLQIASMIATGVLLMGTRLPPIRQLAGDLGLAPGTVARAYRELEQQGLIVTRGRRGTIVQSDRPATSLSNGQLEAAAHAFAVRAHQLGVDATAALDAARTALNALQNSADNPG